MSEVAIEIIKTGHSNPTQISPKGNSALSLAEKNNMTNVIDALMPFFKRN